MLKATLTFNSSLVALVLAGAASSIVTSTAQDTTSYVGISSTQPTGAAAIARDGLVAAYDMSTLNADGTLRDFGPNGHHGRLLGTTPMQGFWSGARLFQKATDRIALPESAAFAIDGPLSIAIWFRVNALGLHQHLLACDDKFAVWLTEGNRLRFVDTVGDGAMTKDPLTNGRWYSFVGTFSGTRGERLTERNIQVYVDGRVVPVELVGQPRDQPQWNPGRLYDSDACYIGFESHQGEAMHQTLRFDGVIDELLVFNRPLTLAEIRAHTSGVR